MQQVLNNAVVELQQWKSCVLYVVHAKRLQARQVLELRSVVMNPAAIVNDRPILSSERMLHRDYNRKCSDGK
jgi:hypothetical protein